MPIWKSLQQAEFVKGKGSNKQHQLVPLLRQSVYGRLAAPKSVSQWTLTTLREKLMKTGAKVTRHSKYVTFQLAEVVVTRDLFAAILDRIARLAIPPPPVARVYV